MTLEKLGLTTLEERRARGDLVETFKILNNYENVDKRKFFENRVYGGNIRGHRQMLQKHQVNKEEKKFLQSVGYRQMEQLKGNCYGVHNCKPI